MMQNKNQQLIQILVALEKNQIKKIILGRRKIIDDAPAKELIQEILNKKDFNDFREFYLSRIKWNSYYPLISDFFCTYSIFQDLINNIAIEDYPICFNYSLQLALI